MHSITFSNNLQLKIPALICYGIALFFPIFCLPDMGWALDWDHKKYKFPEEDPYFMAHVQPDTEEYSWLCMAAQSDVLERVLQEEKNDFIKLVEKASRIILAKKGILFYPPHQKEWEKAFHEAHTQWLKQLDLDGQAYEYGEAALGGNGSERDKLRFMANKIRERKEEIKKSWWMQ